MQHENLIHAIQCIVIVFNDIMSKSREQRFITKEHIATHTNLLLLLYTPATRMARPLLKLKHSVLLVMYSRFNALILL